MTSDSSWQAWCQRFDALHDNVLDLFHSRRVWQTIRAMIETAPNVQRSGIPEHWLTRCYTTSQMSAIRRQLDRNPKAASLWRSLEQLATTPAMATRAWFTAQLQGRGTDPRYLTEIAGKFDLFASPSMDCVDRQIVLRDRDSLVAVGATAEAVVNKVVAHHEYQPPKKPPEITWRQFDNAIDVIGDLYKKYYQLRHPGSVLGNLIPELPAGWDRLFETAWKPS